MPSKPQQFEINALSGLCDHLTASGRPATFISIPEGDKSDPLTVDGRIEIEGQHWAAEHSRVTYDQHLVPAEAAAELWLRPPLVVVSG